MVDLRLICPNCHCSTVLPIKGHEGRHGQIGLLVRYECRGCAWVFDMCIVNTATPKPESV